MSLAEKIPSPDRVAVRERRNCPSLGFITAILITLLVFGFHFYFLLHAGGFWRDEVNLLNVAHHHSLAEMSRDSFPVLMPLLVKICGSLGVNSDLALRSLGMIIGLGSIIALWLAAWIARRSPPLISLALFGLNSTVISFGDSLRPYGLGSLLIAFTFAAAWWFLKKTSWPRAALVAALAGLSVQSLYHNAVLVGAVCLGAAIVCCRRKDWMALVKILSAGAAAAISLLPYVPNFVGGKDSTVVLRTGISWTRFFSDLTTDLGFPGRHYVFVWGVLALLALACAAWALWRKVPAREQSADTLPPDEVNLFAGTTLLLAAGGFLFFLWFTAMPGQPWYFLPIMVLVAMCFDATISTLPCWTRCALLAGVIATVIISFSVVRRDLDYRFTNIDIWSRGLTAETTREDFILVVPWFCGLTFDHYFKGATSWDTIPPLVDHSTHRYDLVRIAVQQTNVMQPVLEKISATLQSGHRVWLLAPVGALQIPAPQNFPPRDLPPAPLPDSGWADEPYAGVWSAQAMQFLSSHGRSFARVNNPNASSRVAENMELFRAEGWNNSPAPDANPDAK